MPTPIAFPDSPKGCRSSPKSLTHPTPRPNYIRRVKRGTSNLGSPPELLTFTCRVAQWFRASQNQASLLLTVLVFGEPCSIHGRGDWGSVFLLFVYHQVFGEGRVNSFRGAHSRSFTRALRRGCLLCGMLDLLCCRRWCTVVYGGVATRRRMRMLICLCNCVSTTNATTPISSLTAIITSHCQS